VQDLRTIIENAPMSGERIFRAEAELVPPVSADFEQIRSALEDLADDMMIDLKLKAEKE
jgi:glycine cleavage system regulatory protein